MNNTPLGLIDSLLVTVVGMAIVFAGLTLLIGLIKLLVAATNGFSSKKKNAAQAPAVPAVSRSAAPAVQETKTEEDDGALIAAITAAISCMLENKNQEFVVRHVRRIHHAPAWQQEGRNAQIRSTF